MSLAPLFSLIIPVYNTGQWLERCLLSIQGQSFKDYEVLLIDDGSVDGSGVLCDAWASADPRYHVVHQSNMGVSAARNCGMELARGEWIWFVDSDDWIASGSLGTLAEQVADTDANLLVFGLTMVDSSGKEVGRVDPPSKPDEVAVGPLQCGNPLYCATHLVRRSAVGSLRFNTDLALHEDRLFFYKLGMEQCRRTEILQLYPYAYYVSRPGSAVCGASVSKVLKGNDALAEILACELERGCPMPAYSDYVNNTNGCVAAILRSKVDWGELARFFKRLKAHGEYARFLDVRQRLKRRMLLVLSATLLVLTGRAWRG